MEDAIIIQELVNKNPDAYEWLFEKYHSRMVAHAHTILRDDVEAEDVVQELFVKLLEFKGWDKVLDLRSYMARSAHNIALHRVRVIKKRATQQSIYNRIVKDFWLDINPLQILRDEKELQGKVHRLLLALSPKCQQAFRLVYLQGHSYTEAAEIMGVEKNTLKTHLRLGMKTLRRRLLVLICASVLMNSFI